MEKRKDSKHNKKMRKLILLCLLCGIVLTVSTYAWFIGMKTVKVEKFDINIATTEGLYLSMQSIPKAIKITLLFGYKAKKMD